jgi:hypothetical protein
LNNVEDTIVIEFTFNVNDNPAINALSLYTQTLDARINYASGRTVASSQTIRYLEPEMQNVISHDQGFQVPDGADTATYTFSVSMTGAASAIAYRVCGIHIILLYYFFFSKAAHCRLGQDAHLCAKHPDSSACDHCHQSRHALQLRSSR